MSSEEEGKTRCVGERELKALGAGLEGPGERGVQPLKRNAKETSRNRCQQFVYVVAQDYAVERVPSRRSVDSSKLQGLTVALVRRCHCLNSRFLSISCHDLANFLRCKKGRENIKAFD